MTRERPTVPAAYSADGPVLQAILDALHDLYDLLDDHFPASAAGGAEEELGGLVLLTEPAQPPPAAPIPEKPRPLPDPPPSAGRGSARTAWASWADLVGVEVTDGMTRDDIITACRRAGLIDSKG